MVATVRALNTRYSFDAREVALYGGVAAGALIALTFVWDIFAARAQGAEEPEAVVEWDPMAGGHPVPPMPGQTLPELTAVGSGSTLPAPLASGPSVSSRDDAGTEEDR